MNCPSCWAIGSCFQANTQGRITQPHCPSKILEPLKNCFLYKSSSVQLCYVMSSYVMLCYVKLCYVMLCQGMLCYVMLCYVKLSYVMLCYVMSSYVILCYVMLCYVMLCYVMLCYVMLCYVMLCYVMLCYVMLCYFMLYKAHECYLWTWPKDLINSTRQRIYWPAYGESLYLFLSRNSCCILFHDSCLCIAIQIGSIHGISDVTHL